METGIIYCFIPQVGSSYTNIPSISGILSCLGPVRVRNLKCTTDFEPWQETEEPT